MMTTDKQQSESLSTQQKENNLLSKQDTNPFVKNNKEAEVEVVTEGNNLVKAGVTSVRHTTFLQPGSPSKTPLIHEEPEHAR